MRHPHPWLARLAWVGVGLGLAAGLAAAGLTLLPRGPAAPWYGSQVVARWQGVTTAGQAWAVGREQFEALAAVVVGPAGWVLTAGLLRLVATGRVGWIGHPHGLVRLLWWAAAAGMAVGLLAGLANGARWYDPSIFRDADSGLPARLRRGVEAGAVFRFEVERQPGDDSRSFGHGSGGPTDDPAERNRRAVMTACAEGYGLFRSTRSAGVLFFACGIVYCLGRPRPDPES